MDDGRAIGFVTVAHDADRFMSAIIRQRFLSLSYHAVRSVLRRPRTAVTVMEVLWTALTSRPDDVRGEIVFIAVDASHQGSGVGTALVRASLAYLAERRVPRCRTKTLAGNAGVIGMYRRLGWDVRDRFRLIGRDYVTIVSPPVGRD
jgi:ribosomal protein S18 acetylase RimI-like enzyme